MFPLIVADIGGTNARFALCTAQNASGQYTLDVQHTFAGADYPSFEECFAAYLDMISGRGARAAVISIAAPITGNRVEMTNLPWAFTTDEVQAQFHLDGFYVINDFTAQACSLPVLGEGDLQAVKPGREVSNVCKAVLGPGTGLGVAGLLHTPGGWFPITGEGGHQNWAPASARERAVAELMRTEGDYVSLENLLCGRGLLRLYEVHCHLNGRPVRRQDPAQITAAALNRSDADCLETVLFFISVLGSAAGNLALAMGAISGVYIAGGIMPRIASLIPESHFVDRFTDKGLMVEYTQNIPVWLVAHDNPALHGAAAWYQSHIGGA